MPVKEKTTAPLSSAPTDERQSLQCINNSIPENYEKINRFEKTKQRDARFRNKENER